MKRRYAPPLIIFTTPRPGDPSLTVDEAFFKQNPHLREYTRRYIAGETPDLMHPDTWVHVMLRGVERVRGFAPPSVGRNN